MKCENCKAFIPDKSLFCPFCGKRTPNRDTRVTLDKKSIPGILVLLLLIAAGSSVLILRGWVNVSGYKSHIVDFSESEIRLQVGEDYPLSIQTEAKATIGEYTFASSDESVVAVNEAMITGKSAGVATVSVVYGDQCCNRCLVTVEDIPPTEFSVDPLSQNSLTAKVGRPFEPPFVFSPDNTTDRSVNYLIDDSSIAAVQDGRIVGLKPGTTWVTAVHKTTNLTSTFRVTFEPVVLEDLCIMIPTSMVVGEKAMLNCTFTPSDTTEKTVWWSSSSPCVSISGEILTAMSAGTAVITVYGANGIQDSIQIQVR